MVDPIRDLKERILPRCEVVRDDLAKRFPTCKVQVWSSPTGSKTSYDGYDVGVEVLLPGAEATEADHVALVIGVKHVGAKPLLCDASVGWGTGTSPDSELDLITMPVAYNEEVLAAVERGFPEMVRVLEQGIDAWFQKGA